MSDIIHAYTKLDPSYPGYVNVSREDDGSVVLTVRGDPSLREGFYVCGFPRDKGRPGRCIPGDEHCNNYCNLAPEKGPMAASPATAATHTDEAETVVLKLSEHEWHAILFALEMERREREREHGRAVPPHGSGP